MGELGERQNLQSSVSQILSLVGLSQRRLTVTLAVTGANTIGIVSAASSFLALHVAIAYPKLRWVFVPVSGISLFALILTDARGPLLVLLLAMGCYALMSRRALALVAASAVAFAPFSALALNALLAGPGSLAAESITRSTTRAGELGAGTGRPIIWEAGFRWVETLRPEQMFGSGLFGHVSNGVFRDFLWIFDGRTLSTSMHNYALQMIMDVGYFGLLASLVMLLATFGVLARSSAVEPQNAKGIMAFLLLIQLCGYTEVVGGPYHFEVYIMLLGVVSAVAALPSPAQRAHKGPGTSRGRRGSLVAIGASSRQEGATPS
ncbi:O-antigen ligase family protein [Phenylobacterium sp. VNQ135]|uniref:O-antigen ligase family protein n=1 Tax=Phenylobacterium sp. VNQ135 TaxID=3400922 RepID=UPI003BFD34D3